MTCPLHPEVTQPCHLCGVARVRAALSVAPRPPVAAEPVNPTHDLARTRAKADKEARK